MQQKEEHPMLLSIFCENWNKNFLFLNFWKFNKYENDEQNMFKNELYLLLLYVNHEYALEIKSYM